MSDQELRFHAMVLAGICSFFAAELHLWWATVVFGLYAVVTGTTIVLIWSMRRSS